MPRSVFPSLVAVVIIVGTVAADEKTNVPALIKQLKDKNEIVRLKGAKTLGKLGAAAKDAVPALTEAAANDDDADVRSVAKKALESIKGADKKESKELAEIVKGLRSNIKGERTKAAEE